MPYLIRETNDTRANITAHVADPLSGRIRCGVKPRCPDNARYAVESLTILADGYVDGLNGLCRNCAALVARSVGEEPTHG